MRNPRIVVSFCLVFLALLIGAGFAIQAQNDQPVLRIGVLDSERGAISDGARLAVREINASGGIANPQGIAMRLELVIEPPTVANQYDDAILRLAQADVDVILGPETTDAVLSTLPLLQTLNIPILTPATGDLVIASDSSGLVFRTRAAERWQGIALADYLVSRVNVRQIVSVQLDQSSLGEHIGFQNALLRRPERLERAVLRYNADDGIPALVSDVIERNPQAVVAFGSPRLASRFYTDLRAAGWFGLFAYNQATNPIFIRNVPLEALYGVLSTTTWSLDTPSSRTFVNNYLDSYDEAPGAIEAATYDAVFLLAEALRRPGDLRANLASLRDLLGVQGVLNPTGLAQGELSSTVAIIQLNAFGGTDLRLRYAFGQPIQPDVEVTPTATPSPTATPAGVTLTIMSSVQNVRTGPGLQYGVIGQMRQGETARVIGAAADFSWVVINFRGQQGWLATYLLELTGDLRIVPIIPAPPLPTPTPTSTPQPVPIFIVIQSPLPGNLVAGNVGIYGSALHPQFLQYQLDFSLLPNITGIWTPIAISQTPVLNGVLGTWNTMFVPDGVYQIRLSVILRDGLVLSTLVSSIRVQNRVATPIPTATPIIPAPVAAFTPDRAGGEAPLTVRFNNQSTGNISRIQWNFGDGTTSTETSPTHTFTTPGIYTVTLEVSGPGGTSNFSWQINVRTISAPSAGFSLSTASGRAPLTVQFSDQSVGNITSWLWNFGDGTTSTERSPSHTFTNVGTYNVFLTVTGPGGTSIASRQVVVENPVSPPPIALFSAQPNSGTVPLTVQFSNQSTGSITGYTWNFGDGSLSSETNPVHTFTVPGTYTVTLYASGPGGSSTAQVIIMVSAPTATPTATFTATIISQPVEETATPIPPTVTFTPTETPTENSLPPTPTFTLTETPTETPMPPTATFTLTETPLPPTPTFTLTETPTETPVPPTPTFTLTETPTETPLPPTPTFTLTETPTETPVPPTETPVPPLAQFTVEVTNDPLTFQFVNQSSGAIASLLWDFGDGTTSADANPTHTFASAGEYNVTLTVSGIDGVTTNSASQIVIVEGAPQENTPVLTLARNASTGTVSDAAWDTNSTRIAAANADGTISLWDAFSGQVVSTLSGHTSPVNAVDWSADSSLLASGSDDGAVVIWDMNSQQPIATYQGGGAVTDLAWASNGAVLAVAGADGTVNLLDTAGSAAPLTQANAPINALAWSAGDTYLLIGVDDGSITLIDMGSGQPAYTLNAGTAVTAVAWSPDSARFATGLADGTLVIWDVASGQPVLPPLGQSSEITTVAWHPGDALVVSGDANGTVQLWDTTSGTTLQTYAGHAGAITAVEWNTVGTQFLSAGEDGVIFVWQP